MYSEGKALGDVLKKMIKELDIEQPLEAQAIIKKWEELVGPSICKYVIKVYFHQNKLFVHLKSAALKQELFVAREKLTKSLNDSFGKIVVRDIIFR